VLFGAKAGPSSLGYPATSATAGAPLRALGELHFANCANRVTRRASQ